MLENELSLKQALTGLFGPGCREQSRRPVSGGDINRAFMLNAGSGSGSGRLLFLKENRRVLAPMFAAEAAGLQALGAAAEISESPPVPQPLAWGTDGASSFLLMEYIQPGSLKSGEAFGRSLALLHRTARQNQCGFSMNNWIGSTPQINTPAASWHEFFGGHRLGYQWELARKNGYGTTAEDRRIEKLISRLPEILPNVDDGRPSLLHGDLWGGNWMASSEGRACLIDPAVYYGHREADLAMTRLFGGGFESRVPVYNLYHLLNHLNLFGASYWGGVRSVLRCLGS